MIDQSWRRARRILAVRLDNLGDVLLTTPAIRAIRESLPSIEITLLASPVGAQAGKLNPDIAGVIEYEAPWVDPWQQLPHCPEREQAMIERLRDAQFDAAIIFTSFRQSSLPAAYLCYLADIPLRLGASVDGSGSLLTTRHRHPDTTMHEVERGLDLVGAIGIAPANRCLVLAVPDAARQRICRRHAEWTGAHRRDGQSPLVVVHPGSSMPARRYPPERYTEVIAALVEDLGATVILTGVDAERALVTSVLETLAPKVRAQVHDLAGTLPFPDLCALVESADLVVTNNTGPMHVAAAVATPVVALFALTNPPEQWAPWMVPHRILNQDVPCRICYCRVCPYDLECLRPVAAADVVAAARDLGIGSDRRGVPVEARVFEPALMDARS